MAYIVGDTVVVNTNYVNTILMAQPSTPLLAQALEALGHLGGGRALVTELGIFDGIYYVKLVPTNTSSLLWNGGSGAVIYFTSTVLRDNSLVKLSEVKGHTVSLPGSLTKVLFVDGGNIQADQDGSFNNPYSTIQAAINAVPSATTGPLFPVPGASQPQWMVVVTPGTYLESIVINSQRQIAFFGWGQWRILGITWNVTQAAFEETLCFGALSFGDVSQASWNQGLIVAGSVTITSTVTNPILAFGFEGYVTGSITATSVSGSNLLMSMKDTRVDGTLTGQTTGVPLSGATLTSLRNCRLLGAVTANAYNQIDNVAFDSGLSITLAPSLVFFPSTAVIRPPGIRGSRIASSFVGPSNSLLCDAVTNNWLVRAGTTVSVGAKSLLESSDNTVVVTSTPYVASTASVILVDATAAPATVALPSAAIADQRYYIKKIDASANAVTVDPSGAELIDGAATYSLSAQFNSIEIISASSAWHILSVV